MYKCQSHDCVKSHKELYGHDVITCPKGCGVCLGCVVHCKICKTCGDTIYLCSPSHVCSDSHKKRFGHKYNPCSTCVTVCMTCYPKHNHDDPADVVPPYPDWSPVYDERGDLIGWDDDGDGVPDHSPVVVPKPPKTDPESDPDPDNPNPTPDPEPDPDDEELELPEEKDLPEWPESKALNLFAEKLAVPSFITSFGDKVVVSDVGKWVVPLDLSDAPFYSQDYSFTIDLYQFIEDYPRIVSFLRSICIVAYALAFIFGIYKALRQW